MPMAMLSATKPTDSEIRAPYTIRASTSRPRSSVPSGCAPDGGSRILRMSIRFGSCEEKSDGNSARTKKNRMTAAPAIASGLRDSRRSVSPKMEFSVHPARSVLIRGSASAYPTSARMFPSSVRKAPIVRIPMISG